MTALASASIRLPSQAPNLAKAARMIGLFYLVVAVCGGFAQVVRTSVVEQGDPIATAQNILDSEFLFRVGFSSDIVAFSAEVIMAILIYVFFRSVNEVAALAAALFRLAQATVLGINMLNQYVALLLVKGTEYEGALGTEELGALTLLSMEAHEYGYYIGLVFFGFSSFALGFLIVKSDYFPKIFGWLLMTFVTFGYIIDSFAAFFGNTDSMVSTVLIAPAAIVEICFALWVLIKGASVNPEKRSASA